MARETLEESVVQTEQTQVVICDECGDVLGEEDEAEYYPVAVNPDATFSEDGLAYAPFDEIIAENTMEVTHEEVVEVDRPPKTYETKVVPVTDASTAHYEAVEAVRKNRRTVDIEADYTAELCLGCAENVAGLDLSEPTPMDVYRAEDDEHVVRPVSVDGVPNVRTFSARLGACLFLVFLCYGVYAFATMGAGAEVYACVFGAVSSYVWTKARISKDSERIKEVVQ